MVPQNEDEDKEGSDEDVFSNTDINFSLPKVCSYSSNFMNKDICILDQLKCNSNRSSNKSPILQL